MVIVEDNREYGFWTGWIGIGISSILIFAAFMWLAIYCTCWRKYQENKRRKWMMEGRRPKLPRRTSEVWAEENQIPIEPNHVSPSHAAYPMEDQIDMADQPLNYTEDYPEDGYTDHYPTDPRTYSEEPVYPGNFELQEREYPDPYDPPQRKSRFKSPPESHQSPATSVF